jgi:glycosyltransferase involved in cell wall biosynthesis
LCLNNKSENVWMPYELSIIIVNWNGGQLLSRCIETIVTAKPAVTYEILIVDNASEDDSLAQLKFSGILAPLIANEQLRIHRNSDNRGFGAANNQGFALTDSPFVLLLNLDTEVRPGTIETLMRTMQSDPSNGSLRAENSQRRRSLADQRVFQSTACLAHGAVAVEALSPAAARRFAASCCSAALGPRPATFRTDAERRRDAGPARDDRSGGRV